MNEDIGARGGKNDRRRVIKIKNNKLKELQEIEELEREVKKKQISNLIKLIPLTIIGQTLKIFDIKKEEKKQEEKETVDNKEITKKEEPNVIIKGKIIVYKNPKQVKEKPISKEPNIIEDIPIIEKEKVIEETKKEVAEKEPVKTTPLVLPIISQKVEEKQEEATVIPKEIVNKEEVTTSNEVLDRIKSKEIVDVYYKELRDIRSDLKNLIFDYNILADQSNDLYTSKEAEKLLDSLNYLIKKIEELKRKLQVENLDKYDENYIYTLIEKYVEEFNNKKVIKEIKDSDLFIDISSKIDELASKKDKLKNKVSKRKDTLKGKEDKFNEIKEKYYSMDYFNDQMYALQKEQEALLKRVQEKVATATTIEEKVRTKVEYFDNNARNLLKLFALEMLIPGARGAKRVVTASALYLYYMDRMMHPKVTTEKYKEIRVVDYSYTIEKSIDELEKIDDSIIRTTKEIDKIINSFKKDYSEFMDVIPEYNDFLYKLNKVKENLQEKEKEISSIKEGQEKQLEINKVNVKKRGIYDM